MRNHKFGQITIINMLAVFITFVLYLALTPVLNTMIENSIGQITCSCSPACDPCTPTTNDMTDILFMLMRIVPFFILLALVITLLNWAIPHREGVGY